MVVCAACQPVFFFSGSVDQTAHDATAQKVSMVTHKAEVGGSRNGLSNRFTQCAAYLPSSLQHCQYLSNTDVMTCAQVFKFFCHTKYDDCTSRDIFLSGHPGFKL